MRRVWVTLVSSFAGLALLALPGSASAAQVVGSNLAANPTIIPAVNSTSFQSVQPPGNTLPVTPTSAGVIVSIRLKHGTTGADPGTYGFRILSGLLPNLTARIPVEQPDLVWPANDTAGTRTFIPTAFGVPGGTPKGIPIAAIEYLGFVRIGGTGAQGLFMRAPTPGAERRFVLTVHNSGSADYSSTNADSENLIQYTVEPDADRDGFGDETQDKCPTDATTQGTCPAVKKKCKKKKKRKGKKSADAAKKKKKKGCKKKRKKKK